jgi:hypothetical protein
MTNEIFFHQICMLLSYSVYINDLATKIATILVTSCIMPHGTHLDLCHMAHKFKHKQRDT